ncbi:PAS domain-containing hybrid sensor histidine kinase/response regulator [Paraglaciecola psychrophila]|uniref:histidine kinase n=1 Tax=Paraglaciecola psychrophila 170 TaxID=1129794 RepID=K7AB36_9ALTE|nr:PAS domain-containing hybrid sensor histidine kinase/response regulator [Paraglaciecola psychrophila]AGH45269.1 multi-sensor hybrid histidine kinase [Paraglaciecola psychrophila 170]GAC39497.1 multidomain protein [Paraglaciecola psychrophila 170]
MINVWTVSALVLCYLLVLFALAFWADKRYKGQQQHPFIYSLALGVHCTSWAFFGTTTQATQYGWAFVPTYLGVILVFLFAHPVLRKISLLCHQHQVSSLADFISLRFEKSYLLAALVTLLCLIGVIPYIALQLDSVSQSVAILVGIDVSWSENVGAYVAILMALFAILFGTQSLSASDKHPGLMLTIAFASLVKLVALLIVGVYVCYVMFDGVLDLFGQAQLHPKSLQIIQSDSAIWVYLSHMLLGVCSMFCLPRQFHINFVENNGSEELRTARWMFPLYLCLMTVFILPIGIAGHIIFDETMQVSTDTYALALPIQGGNTGVALISFIGGLSAATSMVVVATLAMGIMISNNLVTPLRLKIQLQRLQQHNLTPKAVLFTRRATVVIVMGIAFLYHLDISKTAPLVKSGIIAIALLSQTLPIIIGGLYWQKRNKTAAMIALLAGALCWVYWLLWPSIIASYYFALPPDDLQLASGFVLSLLVNLFCFVLFSLILPASKEQQIGNQKEHAFSTLNQATKISKLLAVTEKVLDKDRHQFLLNNLPVDQHSAYASPKLLANIENEIANQVGNVSARILLSAIAEKKDIALAELVELVEEASQTFHFNHEVLQSSVEHIQQGICVVDVNLALLAWNQRYIQLFDYPKSLIKVGIPIKELLLFNAQRGLFGKKEQLEEEIEKRIQYMRVGSHYKYVREQKNGQTIEVNGSPLPGGGFVTTYSDITDYINIQQQLQQSKQHLESRVIERTEQLQTANLALDEARQEAEKAYDSKSKFLAAAGHDLMQPFNAASLFASLIKEKAPNQELAEMSQNLIQSLANAEELLSTLLDMTRLDSGILNTNIQHFRLSDLLTPLVNEFTILAKRKDLGLKYVANTCFIQSDKKLLRRILQNLISNAVRYTESGKILVVAKRHNQQLKIRVYDTGQGIAADQQKAIFEEFNQLDQQNNNQGLGLGLTIVERFSALLSHAVEVKSAVNHGSCFEITVPRGLAVSNTDSTQSYLIADSAVLLKDKVVVIIENDEDTIEAVSHLLRSWGATVYAFNKISDALTHCPICPNLLFLDYHLDNGATGAEAAAALRNQWQVSIPAVLSSADRTEEVRRQAIDAHLHYLPKPIKPAALKRFIKQVIH